MKTPAKLSIVTPSYNQGKYIEQTLRSILASKVQPGELQYIIVDALSNDSTDRCIRRYLPKLKKAGIDVVYIRERDRGQSDAINKGWRRATGKVLGYLNSDDYYMPGVLPKIIKFFDANKQVQWAYGGWNIVNEKGVLFRSTMPNHFDRDALRTYAASIGQPSCFYRRSLLKTAGGVNEDLHLAMDYDLWLRFLRESDPSILPFVVSNMRYYADAKSAKYTLQHNKEAYLIARGYLNGENLLLLRLYVRYVLGWLMIKLGRNISQQVGHA